MTNVSEELAQLAKLRDEGVLTEAEFEAEKARVLRGQQPGAGVPAKKKGGIGKGCLIAAAAIIGLLILLAIIGGLAGDKGGQVTPPGNSVDQVENAAPAADAGPSVSLEGYNRLRNGMTYDEVVAIIGQPSSEMARNEIAGTETVAYMWEGRFGANMNAMFQNGKMVQKAQFGLK